MKCPKGTDHSEDLGVDGKFLKWISKNVVRECELDWSGSGQEYVQGTLTAGMNIQIPNNVGHILH
jgi:hypothetical protein